MMRALQCDDDAIAKHPGVAADNILVGLLMAQLCLRSRPTVIDGYAVNTFPVMVFCLRFLRLSRWAAEGARAWRISDPIGAGAARHRITAAIKSTAINVPLAHTWQRSGQIYSAVWMARRLGTHECGDTTTQRASIEACRGRVIAPGSCIPQRKGMAWLDRQRKAGQQHASSDLCLLPPHTSSYKGLLPRPPRPFSQQISPQSYTVAYSIQP
ncbi:hypothetical protein V8C26DRAFT_366880 [Trichoderma gracile]